jgi:hypothetical protein
MLVDSGFQTRKDFHGICGNPFGILCGILVKLQKFKEMMDVAHSLGSVDISIQK